MQISASTFSDPAMRDRLQQYYDKRKAELHESLKARDNSKVPDTISYRGADGTTKTATYKPVSADKMMGALVSFDKWLEFQAESFENPIMGPDGLARAQEQLDRLETNSPESSSEVRSTFANDGALLAYINADGTAVLSQAAHGKLQPVLDKADRLNLTGQQRIDYLNQQFGAVLSEAYPELETARYDASTAPSKREFAQMWYPSHDVDQHYDEAMAAAREHYDRMNGLHQQWQDRMNEIGSFLLGLQESEPA